MLIRYWGDKIWDKIKSANIDSIISGVVVGVIIGIVIGVKSSRGAGSCDFCILVPSGKQAVVTKNNEKEWCLEAR